MQHHLLAHSPARWTGTVLGDVRVELLFDSCHREAEEQTPWVACGQRGGAGGNLSKPFCRVSEPLGCWYHILPRGTPRGPGAAAAGERKLAARRSRLTQRSAEHRKQLTRGEGLVATCLLLSCCGGHFFFFPPAASHFPTPAAQEPLVSFNESLLQKLSRYRPAAGLL